MTARHSLRHAGVVLGLVSAAPVLAFQEAAAAAEAAPEIPDPAITAERRPDTVQAVPMAVTAFSAEALSARNLDTPLLIANAIPNMFASNAIGLGSANSYTLRGLGQDATAATFSPAVATFVDDIYFGGPAGNNFRFFDIGRAEVLRGPQGTLYGRNTIGGAIAIINNRPSDTLGGYGEFAYGAYDRKLARGSIDLPFSPAISLKLSGYLLEDNGYVKNTTTGERLNDSDAAGLRGAVQVKITDTLRWNLAATYVRGDGENLPNSLCDPNAPTVCNGRFAATGRTVNQPLGAANPIMPLGNRLDTQFYTSHLEWAADSFAVSAITGFVNTRDRSAIDLSDGRAFPSADVPFPRPIDDPEGYAPITSIGRYSLFSQELKLIGSLFGGRIDAIAGLLYTDENNTADSGFDVTRNGTIDKAAYLQLDLNATDRLRLTAGARYTDESTTFSIQDTTVLCAANPLLCRSTANLVTGPLRTPIPTTRKTRQWSPRLAASYRIDDGVLAYASAARGFRSGGWDARSASISRILPFDAETAWTYEGGIKADAFGGRLRFNVTGFWLEASNLQAPLVDGARYDGVGLFGREDIVQNVGGFRNRGIELEMIAVPVTGLNLTASLGYQNAEHKIDHSQAANSFGLKSVARQQEVCRAQLAARAVPLASEFAYATISERDLVRNLWSVVVTPIAAVDCAAGIVDANGNVATPPRTPDFSLALGGSYDWAIPSAGIIFTPSVNALYRSAYEAGAANATLFTGSINGPGTTVLPANPFAGDIITGSRNPAVWQVAAALTMRTDDGNWTLALECENCLDTAFTQSVVGTVSYLNPPRVWQIRARRAF